MDEEAKKHSDSAAKLAEAGRLPQAVAELVKAVALAPGDLALRQRLGDIYARMGLRTHAVREFQAVAGRYASEGLLLKAIAFCKLILELDPGHTETQRTLADLFAAQHETLPIVQRLPVSMSAAADTQPAAPLDVELFRKAVALRSAANDEEEGLFDTDDERATVQAPRLAGVDLARLPPIPLFSSLSREAFTAVVEKLELRWVQGGETVLREGEPGDAMYVLVQGAVDVLRAGGEKVAHLREGSFFGEMALVAESRRLATVVAARDLLLLVIDRQALIDLTARHPDVKRVIDRLYQERLLANVLLATPIFRPFSASERREIAARFVRHTVAPWTVLLEQGKPGAGLCVLLRGRCEVFHTGGKGDRVDLPEMKEGAVFGEISLLLDGPCTATVRASTPCEVLELSRDDFRRLVLPHPQVNAMIRQLMAERIGRTAEVLERTHGILPDFIV